MKAELDKLKKELGDYIEGLRIDLERLEEAGESIEDIQQAVDYIDCDINGNVHDDLAYYVRRATRRVA